MPSPFAPEETPVQLFNERALLQGAFLSNVAYGIELVLFILCFDALRYIDRPNIKRHFGFLAFVSILFVLGTLIMASNNVFMQLSFIDNRNFPGGPGGYQVEMIWAPVNNIDNISFAISNWMMDMLLVWRCSVIYQGCGIFFWIVMIISSFLFAVSLAFGLLVFIKSPTSWSQGSTSTIVALTYFTSSVALNIFVTVFIVVRLLLHRNHVAEFFGSTRMSHYTHIATIFIESASLYSIFTLAFIIPFALNHPISQVFGQIMNQVQVISSLLIIYRAAQGKVWKNDTSTARTEFALASDAKPGINNVPSICFAPAEMPIADTMQTTSVTVASNSDHVIDIV